VNFRAAGEHFPRLLGEERQFLDAKVRDSQVQVHVRGVPHRRDVAGAVEGGSHAEELPEGGHLARRRQPADVGDVHADKVDQTLADERHVLCRADKQLAQGDGRGALLAHHAQVVDVLRREQVFEEEQAVLLQGLGQPDGLNGGNALVDVVQQFHFVPEGTAQVGEQARRRHNVRRRLPGALLGRVQRVAGAGPVAPVGRVPADRHLAADVAEALLQEAARVLLHLGERGTRSVDVDRHCLAALAAEQLVERHPSPLGLDVPQRLVDATEGVVQHRPAPPVAAQVARLPDVLDAVNVAPEHKGAQILVNGRRHGERPLGEGGAAEAVQAVLAGQNLDDHQADAVRRSQDGLDVGNSHGLGHDGLLGGYGALLGGQSRSLAAGHVRGKAHCSAAHCSAPWPARHAQ